MPRGVFGEARAQQATPIDLKGLHAKISELMLENDSNDGALTKAGLRSVKR